MSVVEVERRGEVAVVRLNRPDALNALNVELLNGLVDALREVRSAAAIVLEGAGRAFCAGEDLKETLAPRTHSAPELRESFALIQETTRLLAGAEGPSVAVVHGYAIGGGAELALAADLVVAGPNARFRFPEVSLGHAVTGGITARLPLVVGLLRAKELLLTSRWVEAPEAASIGLVNELAEDAHVRGHELAQGLAAHPRRSVTATRRGVELAAMAQLETALAWEVDAATWCFAAAEADESSEAFRRRSRDDGGRA